MMPSVQRIVESGLVLRANMPEVWEEFTTAVREYAAGQTAEMLRCDPDKLVRAQGMALAANELASVLMNVHRIKENRTNG
jgi:hypothetical protein